MLGRTLLLFFILAVSYNCVVWNYKPGPEASYQGWWQENLAKAQLYTMKDTTYQIVLAGSSISSNLNLGSEVYNLSFVGGSVFTGLLILKKSGKIPKTVIIETNYIERAEDEKMLNAVLNPVTTRIKSIAVGLQEAFQPVNIFTTFVSAKLNIKKTDTELHLDNLAFSQKIAHNKAGDEQADTLLLMNASEKLQNLISFFKAQKTNVILMHVPANGEIMKARKYREISTITKELAFKNNCRLIDNSKITGLKTSDGYHFRRQDAAIYSTCILKQISSYAN